MKKICTYVMLALTLLLLPLTAFAQSSDRIVDNGSLLTAAEEAELAELADALADAYAMDVVIVTTDSLDGKTAEAYADDFFDENGYGIGSDHSGVLFLVSMEERDWAISTCGEAIYALTDYGIGCIADEVVPYLSAGEYFAAFQEYLEQLELYFDAYCSGDPIDGWGYDGSVDYQPGTQEEVVFYERSLGAGPILRRLFVALALGAAAGAVALLVMRSQMRTAKPQSGAKSYMVGGSYALYRCQDLFLYSRTTRAKRPEPSEHSSHGGGGGGGSSVHHSSSGHSHGGGHGKF